MKKILLLIFTMLMGGCKTNPPTSPISLKSGEVRFEITYSEDAGINNNKTVLLEDFANVSCIPCVASNKIIQSALHSYGYDKIVAVKFPTFFPSPVDPFYLASKEFCDFRISYYNIFSAPTIILDGVNKPIPTDSNGVKQAIEDQLALTSGFKIDVTKVLLNGGLLFNIDINVKDLNTIDQTSIFLKCVLVESEIDFDQAPGSNGETKFYDVLRVLFPDNNGIPLSNLEDVNSLQYENVIDTLWNINKLEAVIFLQSSNTKEVYQAGSTFK
jgi:hypothetical protein